MMRVHSHLMMMSLKKENEEMFRILHDFQPDLTNDWKH